MDEADVLAEMFGRKPQPETAAPPPSAEPSPMPPVPSSKPPSARDYGLIVGGLALSALWVMLSVSTVGWAIGRGWLPFGDAGIDAIANLFVFGGLVAIALLFSWLQPLPATHGALARGKAAGLGVALGLAGFLAALLQVSVGGHLIAGKGASAGALLLLAGTVMILFQAAAEELLFRGWLQRRLSGITGPSAAVAIAALAFSLLHIFGGARSIISLINIFLAGLFFGLLVLRTGSVLTSIGAHFIWNWAETMLFGLAPNPGAPPYGAVFDFDLAGASYWGGSDEGLNAAIAVTVALTAVILPLLVWKRQASPPPASGRG